MHGSFSRNVADSPRVVLFLVEVALGGNASWDFAGFS
jgi:hypothetical protein